MHKVVFQSWIDRLRVRFHLQSLIVDADEFLPFTRVFAKTIVGDSVKPRGETGLAAEAAEVFIGAQESFLGEIVGQSEVGPGKLAEQTSHARLMIPNQFGEGVVIIIE
jgi:hypothetical protein